MFIIDDHSLLNIIAGFLPSSQGRLQSGPTSQSPLFLLLVSNVNSQLQSFKPIQQAT